MVVDAHLVYSYLMASVIFLSPQTTGGGGIMFFGQPSGRPSVNTYLTCRGISVFSGGISMKLGTNIHHVSEHC